MDVSMITISWNVIICVAYCYNQKRFLTQNAVKSIWRPCSAPARRGELTALPQIPVAVFKGPFNGMKLRVGRGQGGQLLDPPLVFTWARHKQWRSQQLAFMVCVVWWLCLYLFNVDCYICQPFDWRITSHQSYHAKCNCTVSQKKYLWQFSL